MLCGSFVSVSNLSMLKYIFALFGAIPLHIKSSAFSITIVSFGTFF